MYLVSLSIPHLVSAKSPPVSKSFEIYTQGQGPLMKGQGRFQTIPFCHSRVIPLFTFGGSGDIHILWTHSSFFKSFFCRCI